MKIRSEDLQLCYNIMSNSKYQNKIAFLGKLTNNTYFPILKPVNIRNTTKGTKKTRIVLTCKTDKNILVSQIIMKLSH